MAGWEKDFCDEMLRYGEILKDEEGRTKAGDFVRTYTIKYENETYIINKFNGEWNYIRRVIVK